MSKCGKPGQWVASRGFAVKYHVSLEMSDEVVVIRGRKIYELGTKE